MPLACKIDLLKMFHENASPVCRTYDEKKFQGGALHIEAIFPHADVFYFDYVGIANERGKITAKLSANSGAERIERRLPKESLVSKGD